MYIRFAIILVLTCCHAGQAAILSGPVTNPANGHEYYLLTTASWTASEAEAVSMGGHLVTINDAAEQAWIQTTFGAIGSLWIGLNDVASEGNMVWSSGEAVAYTNWLSGEPNNNAVGGEDYVLMWDTDYGPSFAGLWNDTTDDGAGYAPLGVVEITGSPPPPPAAGNIDPSFGTDGLTLTEIGSFANRFTRVATLDDDRIVAVGMSAIQTGGGYITVAWYTPDGILDPDYGTSGFYVGQSVYPYGLAVQPDGKLVIVGYTSNGNPGDQDVMLIRLNPDGLPDTGFGNNGIVVTSIPSVVQQELYPYGLKSVGYNVAFQDDGKLVVVGELTGQNQILALRYHANGALDTSFKGRGYTARYVNDADMPGWSAEAFGVGLQSDGKIVVGGHDGSNQPFCMRFSSNGNVDTTFGGYGGVWAGATVIPKSGSRELHIKRLYVEPDDSITLAGNGTLSPGSSFGTALIRLDSAGQPDTGFAAEGMRISVINLSSAYLSYVFQDVTRQADGKHVFAGYYTSDNLNYCILLARTQDNGTLDSSFSGNGYECFTGLGNYAAFSAAIQSTGGIVVAGLRAPWTLSDSFIARFYGIIAPAIEVENPSGTGLNNGEDTVNLGAVNVGYGTIPATFTVRNTGLADLLVSSVDIVGEHASRFSIDWSGVSSPIAAGEFGTFTASFSPAEIGLVAATVSISSNDSPNSPFEFQLEGYGIAPDLTVRDHFGTEIPFEGGAFQFDPTLSGQSTPYYAFQLINDGNGIMSGISIQKTGPNAGDFDLDTSTMDTSIPPGQDTVFRVRFNPSGAFLHQVDIQVLSNDPDESPFEIQISGIGLNPAMSLSYQSLGDGPGGAVHTIADDLSGDGQFAVGRTTTSVGDQGFLWDDVSGMQILPWPDKSIAAAVVGPELLVAGTVTTGQELLNGGPLVYGTSNAFIWDGIGDIQQIGELPGGQTGATAYGISRDRSTVVGYSEGPNGLEPFLWTEAGGMQGLGHLPGESFFASAEDVSDDGTVVVGWDWGESAPDVPRTEATRWTQATGLTGLGFLDPAQAYSWAMAVTGDGQTIVGESKSVDGKPAFAWTAAAGMVALPDLAGGALDGTARDITPDGSLIAGSGTSEDGLWPVLWRDDLGIIDLKILFETAGISLTGWTQVRAQGVSDSGDTVLCNGINPSGNYEAFIVRGVQSALPNPDIALEYPLGINQESGSGSIQLADTIHDLSSAPVTVYLRNDGALGLTIQTITKSGDDADAFLIDTTTLDTLLSFGDATQFTVTFNPSRIGQHTALLEIHSNDPDEAPFVVNLVGNGTGDPSVTYTVTFDLDPFGTRTGGGELVQTVVEGAAAVEPVFTVESGWEFTGWDAPFDVVTQDLLVTAQYALPGEDPEYLIFYEDFEAAPVGLGQWDGYNDWFLYGDPGTDEILEIDGSKYGILGFSAPVGGNGYALLDQLICLPEKIRISQYVYFFPSQNGAYDYFFLTVYDGLYSEIGSVNFFMETYGVDFGISADTTYFTLEYETGYWIAIEIDFAQNTADLFIDGTRYATGLSFSASGPAVDPSTVSYGWFYDSANPGDGALLIDNISVTGIKPLSTVGRINEVEGNDTIATAQVLFPGAFHLEANPDIQDSMLLPHVTVNGSGDGSFDYYQVEIVEPGSTLIVDIDHTMCSLDTFIAIWDAGGNVVDENDDSELPDGDAGSGSTLDSFLHLPSISPGTYTIGVAAYESSTSAGGFVAGSTPVALGLYYELNVSVGLPFTAPEIHIEPLTISYRNSPAVSASPDTAASAPIDTQGSSSSLAPAPADPGGEFVPNEVVVRFRGEQAAMLHGNRLAQFRRSDAGWQPTRGLQGMPALPASALKIRPFKSGAARIGRLMASAKMADIALSKAAPLTAGELGRIEAEIRSTSSPKGPEGLFYLKVEPGTDLNALCASLMARDDVVYAHPNRLAQPTGIPDDPLYNRMWNLDRIGMPVAWDISGNTPADVRVCVMDTGVRITHQDLQGRTADPADIYPDNGDAYADADPENDDPHGHGTACAGIIGAIRGNSLDVAGMAPVTIIPVNGHFLNSAGETRIANYTDGIYWGVDHGADVISLSLERSDTQASQAELDAMAYAEQNGVIVCAAAGNGDGDADQIFPSAIPYCISVGAVDDDDVRVRQPKWWWGSNYGSTVDVCAPGQGNVGKDGDSIITLGHQSDTDLKYSFNGTSSATPQVAALCALIKHVNPDLSPAEIRAIVEGTATDRVGDPSEDVLGWDPYHGHGLINVSAALAAATSSFIIYNQGTGDLSIQSISLDQPAGFIGFSPAAPFAVIPGGAQVVSVLVNESLAPTGQTSRQILVQSDDADESIYPDGVFLDVSIFRDVEPGEITVLADGAPVQTGDALELLVAETGVWEFFILTIRNNGLGPLTGIDLLFTGTDAEAFAHSGLPETELAAGTEMQVFIDYMMGEDRLHQATLQVNNSDADENPFLVNLSLQRAKAAISINESGYGETPSGSSISSFGLVEIGTASAPKTVLINNTGTADLYVTDIGVLSGDWQDFALDLPLLPAVVAPESSVSFDVTFVPNAPGSRNATVYVSALDPYQPLPAYVVGVVGNAFGTPEITVTDADSNELLDGGPGLDMGPVAVNAEKIHTVTITNTGTDNLSGLNVTGPGTTVSDPFINEIHYFGDSSQDYIEVAGPAGVELSGWQLRFFGPNGNQYRQVGLAGEIIPDQGGGYGTIVKMVAISDSLPGGVALYFQWENRLVEFLSWGGGITIANPTMLAGAVSQNIGYTEEFSDPGESLQRVGTGVTGDAFSWIAPTLQSPGFPNDGQAFVEPPPPAFSINTNSVPGTLPPGESAYFQVSFLMDALGSATDLVQVFSNDADENPFDIPLSATTQNSGVIFDSVMSSAGLSGPNAGQDDIPHDDGVENILKYAFNMDLSGPDAGSMSFGGTSGLPVYGPTDNGGQTEWTVEYLRRKGSGLSYVPKVSTTLEPGSFFPMGGTETVEDIDGTWERVRLSEAWDAATQPKRFSMVDVTLP